MPPTVQKGWHLFRFTSKKMTHELSGFGLLPISKPSPIIINFDCSNKQEIMDVGEEI